MQTYSQQNDVPKHSAIVSKIAELTGTRKEIVDNIVNKQLKLIRPEERDEFYKNILKKYSLKVEIYNQQYFRNILKEKIAKTKSLSKSINYTIDELVKKQNNVDTINTLAVIRDLLLVGNNKDKNKLQSLLSIEPDDKLTTLNESVNFEFNKDNINYRGLTSILSHNNPRWRINAQVRGSYEQIMNYLNQKFEDIQNADIVELDKNHDKTILYEYITGTVSPVNMNYSINKEMLADIQSLVFDMILLNNLFINQNQEKLQYINSRKVLKYQNISNLIIEEMYSSIVNSKILNKLFIQDLINGKFDNSGGYEENITTIDRLTEAIVLDRRMENYLQIPNMIAMLNFIHSATIDFNLKLRNILREYVNVTNSILTKFKNI